MALKSLCIFIARAAEAGILSVHIGVTGVLFMDIVPVPLIFTGTAFSGTNSIIDNSNNSARRGGINQRLPLL
jgi:hypothetical protein